MSEIMSNVMSLGITSLPNTVSTQGGVALAGRHPELLTKLRTILRPIAVNCSSVLSTISEC